MGQSNEESVPPPLPLFAFQRWLVPVVYLICASLICASLWEDYQRVELAEEVAQLVTEHKPEKVGDVETLLFGHLGARLNDYPSKDNPKHSYRGFRLVPRVWLTLWVEYETETSNVVDVSMTYAASEKVNLEAPREQLPRVPTYEWFVAILPAVVCSAVWLRVARSMEFASWAKSAIAFLAALPLLLYMFGAMIAYTRITM
ncbi:MAG: hypothetical protein IT365_23890 [Candidatus Hydrogenedentes bacterium]|nr:hypothetical protein [Candidatus Hydrogenedentota bacterium]